MSDELVKRLREDQPVTQDMGSTMQCALQDAAADRIEELEAEIVRLEAALKNIRDVAEISDGPQWYAMIADNALTGEGDNIQPERFDEYGNYGENNPPVGSNK